MSIALLTKKYPGMRLWLAQRISAVVMTCYLFLLVMLLMIRQVDNYVAWVEFMSPWWWRIYTLLFFMSLSTHAWLGIRHIFKDYVVNIKLRRSLQIVANLLLLIYLCLVFYILWGI